MINLKVDCSSEIAGIYPASRISSSNSDFAFFPQQMTTLWLNEFICEPLHPAGMLLAVKDSPVSKKTPDHLSESGGKRGISAFDAPVCYPIPFYYFPGFLPYAPTLPVRYPERMVIRGNDRLPEALGFETDNTPFMALHDGVALSEPSFLCQDIIPGFYLPDRFQPFGSETQRISVKARESACKDLDLSSPVPKIGCGNVRIALGVRKPIIQNPVAERINLAVESVLPLHSFGGQVGSAESTEQGSVYQRLPSFLSVFLSSLFII